MLCRRLFLLIERFIDHASARASAPQASRRDLVKRMIRHALVIEHFQAAASPHAAPGPRSPDAPALQWSIACTLPTRWG